MGLGKNQVVEDGLKEMEEILKRVDVGRLALSGDDAPYVVPLNFVYHEGKVVFHCSYEGKKIDLIRRNPACCFEVDEFKGDITYHYAARCHLDYDTVLAFGRVRIENDEENRVRLLQLMAEKYDSRYRTPVSEGGLRIGLNKSVENCCCMVIDVEELTGRREQTVEGERKRTMWNHRF